MRHVTLVEEEQWLQFISQICLLTLSLMSLIIHLKALLSASLTQTGKQRNHSYLLLCTSPAPYSEFLEEFPDFLSNLAMKSDKVIIVGDFNIHVDVDDDCLATAFKSLLYSIGFSQRVNKPTQSFNNILDLVLTCGIDADHITVFPQNPVLSDRSLITFEFTLTNYALPGKKIPLQ